MPEQESKANPPRELFVKIFSNNNTIELLRSKTTLQQREFLLQTNERMMEFTDDELTSFTSLLLKGIASDNETWNFKRREAAIAVLSSVPFGRLDEEKLFKMYIKNVDEQKAPSTEDGPWGSIYSLLQAGKLLAFHLPNSEEEWGQLHASWTRVASLFEESDAQMVEEERDKLLEKAREGDLFEDLELERLGERSKPSFDRKQQVLHDKYMEVTKGGRSFKLTLWNNVPGFREASSIQGLHLQQLWNIVEPGVVMTGLAQLEQSRLATEVAGFNRHVQELTGLALQEMSAEDVSVLADEIVQAASLYVGDQETSVRDYAVVIKTLKRRVESAKLKPSHEQKKMLRPVVQFFQKNGGFAVSASPEIISGFFADKTIMQTAETIYTDRQALKKDSIEKMTEWFHLDEEKKHVFRLLSRNRNDMYTGDLTGDCTAYHLETGENAWTMPVWVTDPGFLQGKIGRDRFIAKVGMTIAVADGKPALVVDSIEPDRKVEDEVAIPQMQAGFQELKTWARKAGIEQIFLYTGSNSKGVASLFSEDTVPSSTVDLSKFMGLDGVTELRKNLLGKEVESEDIYLQTKAYDNEKGQDYDQYERAKALESFEGFIDKLLVKAGSNEKDTISTALRGQQWEMVFSFMIRYLYPHLEDIMNSWQDYLWYLDGIKDIENDSPFSLDITDTQRTREVVNEAIEMNYLLRSVKHLEWNGLSPEDALRHLYGRTHAEAKAKVSLNNKLPTLV